MTDARTPPTPTAQSAPNRTTMPNQPAPLNQTATPDRAVRPNRTVLLIGVALALTATDPANLAQRGPVGWLLTLAAMVAAIWAAPVVAQRPAIAAVHLSTQLVRHRNTVFAAGCTIIAGLYDPPAWLIGVDTALLLAYLLAVDALAAGPIGIRQLQRGVAPLAAAAASAVTLLGAAAPVNTGEAWGRIVAAIAVTAAALAAGAALWIRQRAGSQDSRSSVQPSSHH